MKKYHQMVLLLFLLVAFLLSGCKKEADAPSGEEAAQEEQEGADAPSVEEASQKSREGADAEASQESQAEDFVEVDGSLIERITVYHGEYQETVDAKSAKGRALIKMASSFFENPKASSLSVVLGGICLESLDKLGDMAVEQKDDYFILIELNQKASFAFEDGDEFIAMVNERDIFIIETNQKEGLLLLNLGDSEEEPISCGSVGFMREDEGKMEKFIEKYREWEQMEY
ncbi:hypothetical protein AALC25_06990 [Lachnospiraceae bacterium 29-84]